MAEDELMVLIEEAKKIKMTPEQEEAQRRSFAFGNALLENDMITRESIDYQAKLLAANEDKSK